jgi:hypothetical protein
MQTTWLFKLACLISVICLPCACWSKRQPASEYDRPLIRYGDDGTPTFIKGGNLSAALDSDPVFRDLKANKRYADIALYYLDSQRQVFKLTSARDEFIVQEVKADGLGQKHIRLQQVFHQIPVWGKEVSIHLNGDNDVYYFHGAYQSISSDLITTAAISKETAGQFVLGEKADPTRWRIQHIDVCIWAPSSANQRLAFKVTLMQNNLFRQDCFVDAIDGRILHWLSISPTIEDPITIKKD